MEIISKSLVFINITLLILHQMDAVRTKEWKMISFTQKFQEQTATKIFIALHIFLFLAIFLLLELNFNILLWIISCFGIIHKLLHVLFKEHPKNNSKENFSLIIIDGMFIISLATVILKLLEDTNA